MPPEVPNRLKQIHTDALAIAQADLGKGEDGPGNNQGEYIRYIRQQDGTGRGPKGRGAWCACFISSCLLRAAGGLGYILPVKTTRSAQAIYKRTGRIGRFVDIPEPGDLICWFRTRDAGDWRGHVGICERYNAADEIIHTIEGNRGSYPSYVARYTYSLKRERRRKLLGFSRLY